MRPQARRAVFVARNIAINVARAVVPFSLLKRLFPKRMTGRGKYLAPERKAATYCDVFTRLHAMAVQTGLPWRDRLVVELGPGDHVLLALGWLLAGARQVVMVDRFRFLDMDTVAPSARAILPKLEAALGVAAPPLEDLLARIEWVPVAEASRRLNRAEVGLIYSNSVLEHIHDIAALMPVWRDWLEADGGMLHWVDFKSHGMRVDHELDFLTFDSATWRLMTCNRGSINRQRWPEHRRGLEQAGFEVIGLDLAHYPETDIAAFRAAHPGAWTDEELSVSRAFYACRPKR